MSERLSESGPLPEVSVSTDPDGDAARRVADAVEEVAAQRGRVRLAITGGSAAIVATRAAELLAAGGFDFERLSLTWIDERCVPVASPESNRGTVRFEPAPGVVLPLYLDGEQPEAAAERAGRQLAADFDSALDVVLLGLGHDGHIASIFPGRPALEGLAAYVANSPKPPADRITLTRPLLATAQHTILVASGERKRAALEGLARGRTDLPATGLPGLVVCTDLELGGQA